MKHISITVPPGRLGIHLENVESEQCKTVISSVSSSSPLAGDVFEGDCIIRINGIDVSEMNTSDISEIFQLYSGEEKVLTIIRGHAIDGWTEEVLTIPPGKLGIHLMDFDSDMSRTVISSVSSSSPLAGKAYEGDCIVRVNGIDVRGMDTSGVFAVFKQYSQAEKVIMLMHKAKESKLETEALSAESEWTESTKDSKTRQDGTLSHKHRNHRHHHSNNSTTSSALTEKSSERHRRRLQKKKHHKNKEPLPEEEFRIEIREDKETTDQPELLKTKNIISHGAPVPVGFVFDDSMQSKTKKLNASASSSVLNTNPEDDQDNPHPATLDAESPLPPSYEVDQTVSKTSYSKQMKMHPGDIVGCPTRDCPVPVGFVFDDSISNESSMKAKQNGSSTIGSKDTEHFRDNNNTRDLGNDELSTIPLPSETHEPSYSTRDGSNHNQSEAERSVLSEPDENSRSSDSTSTSHDIEQGLGDQYEIVADAVAVEEPEIYEAEPMSDEHKPPNIIINQMYPPGSEAESKGQDICGKKAWMIILLALIILGSCLVIIGIVFGVKKSPTHNTTVKDQSESSLDISQVSIDDHSQVSQLYFNQTSNHYIIEYANGTIQDSPVVHLSINDPSSIISSLFFNETSNHYVVVYRNHTSEDVGSNPPNLDDFTIDVESSTSSTTQVVLDVNRPVSPTNLFGLEVNESTSTTTTSPTTTPTTTQEETTTTPTTTSDETTTTTTTSSTTSSITTAALETTILAATTPLITTTATVTGTAEFTTAVSAPFYVSGNDKCENAHSLQDFPAYLTGTTEWATADFASALEPICGTSIESKGVWYSIKSSKRAIIRLEYQLKVQDIGDSVLSVYTGSCGISSLTCTSNVVGGKNWNRINDVAVKEILLEPGETYFILLSGATAMAIGEYEFRATEYEIPQNDKCVDAIEILSFPKIFNGTLLGATPDFDESNLVFNACSGMDWFTRGVWYKMTGRGSNIRLEYYLYTIGVGESELSIFTGSCGSTFCSAFVKGADRWNGVNNVAVYEFFAKENEDYWFLLNGEHFDTAGDYELKVSEYEVPDNDECSSAKEISLTPAAPFVDKGHSTLGATPYFTDLDTDTCEVSWNTRGVWYYLIGQGAVVRMEYQLYSQNVGKSHLSVFTGSCGSLACYKRIDADDRWNGVNYLAVFEFIAEKGQTYFVWLAGENFSTAAPYDLIVSEYPIPSNDKCQDANEIVPASSLYKGSSSGSTSDFNVFNKQCGGTENNRGNWYSFTGNGKLTSFSFSPEYDNSQLSLFSGPCESLVCESDYARSSSFSFVPMKDKQYRLFVAGNSFDAAGDYSLSMQQYNPPGNDICTNAIKMTSFPYSISGNMKGSTSDFNTDTVNCGNVEYSGVWYSFVGTGKSFTLELKTIVSSSSFLGEIAVFQGQCGRFECIVQEEEKGTNAIVQAIVPQTTVNAQYKILLATLGLPDYDVPFQFTASEGLV